MVGNFRWSGAHHVLRELSILVRVGGRNAELQSRLGIGANLHQFVHSQDNLQTLAECAATAETLCKMSDMFFGPLNCSHIRDATMRLRQWAAHDRQDWSELHVRARILRDSTETELRDHLFYQYPKEKGGKLQRWKEEWELALKAFPEAEFDIFSATDCYALQHHTASIFHSMRVAEIGLRAVAKERGITLEKDKPIEWGTWQDVITAIDGAIKRIGSGWKAGADKDSALEFYSGLRADMNGFKDEYRNKCMHVRERYDEYQAARALAKVHDFMTRMAKPTKWNDASLGGAQA